MEFGPIWRAMMRNKTSFLLIALQIAVTMAIMVNAIAIIQERAKRSARPSGIDEDNIFYVVSVGFAPDLDSRTMIEEDLRALRGRTGVRDAVTSNTVPLQGGGWSQGIRTEPGEDKDSTEAAIYFVDEHGVDTFGVRLVAGRNFTADDVMWFDPDAQGPRWPDNFIITQALAETLFPDAPDDAVGKTIYIEKDQPVTITGVMERMQAPWESWTNVEDSILVPMTRKQSAVLYVVRTEPGYRDELMPEIEKMLAESNRQRIIRGMKSMQEIRDRSYLQHTAMIKLLLFVVGILTGITGLGIVGLASFSVARRTRQIGTRRALGATRPAILRYFMLENFLISSLGVVSGAVLAVGINIWMVRTFELTPLGWYLIPAAMLVLWLVGQVAVFGPARRASLISPAIATRTA